MIPESGMDGLICLGRMTTPFNVKTAFDKTVGNYCFQISTID